MKMDGNSSDHSPPLSENAGSSWTHSWENEISSVSGLNIDSNSELNALVEDKEVASKAVAFVVNSTRKGIVPLCADVANLLRIKRSLEKKVYILKRENEVLRSVSGSSYRTSHSTSPTPPSFNLYDKSSFNDICPIHERSRPCSRCSQCSSTLSCSPKIDKSRTFKAYLQTVQREAWNSHSPRSNHKVTNGITTQAIVHIPPDSIDLEPEEPESITKRRPSLPEIVSVPSSEVLKVRPKISKEVQCIMPQDNDFTFEEKFIETLKMNSKLSEDLGSAKKEIEILKGRLKELEMNQLARECLQKCYFENECDDKIKSDITSNLPQSNKSKSSRKSASPNGYKPTKKMSSSSMSGPFAGCKCSACMEAFSSSENIGETFTVETEKFSVNNRLQIQLGDHVVMKGDRTGYVRYVGHLDKLGQTDQVFVGLELDAPVGRHGGFFSGKRYFYCRRDYGIFLPLQDVVCKVSKKGTKIEDSEERMCCEQRSSTNHPRSSSRKPRKERSEKLKVDEYNMRTDIEGRLEKLKTDDYDIMSDTERDMHAD